MNDIVTTNEFCERFRISEKLREFYGWKTNTRRLDESTFKAKVQEIAEHNVSKQTAVKRPLSAVPVNAHAFAFLGKKKPLMESNGRFFAREFHKEFPINSLPASRASILSAGPGISKGSIIDTDDFEPEAAGPEKILPTSRCSILQSEFTQASILDSDIHMTTQSSPPPVILSSTCD